MNLNEKKDYIANRYKYISEYMNTKCHKTFFQKLKDKFNAIKRTLFT
jgi:hypothetical protein